MELYDDIVWAWKKRKIENVSDLDAQLDNFRILFAYHSNAIENKETTYHHTREIFENGKVVNFTGDIRTLLEIQNQKECYEYLKNLIMEGRTLDKKIVKKVHELLLKGCYDEKKYKKGEWPGEYKKHDYVVGDDIGAFPEDVESEISELCEEVNAYHGEDILTTACCFHLNFESIHPFADGNSRVGRTLMNYYLMIHGYPPTIIYEENKDAYYMGLAVFDKANKKRGFENL